MQCHNLILYEICNSYIASECSAEPYLLKMSRVDIWLAGPTRYPRRQGVSIAVTQGQAQGGLPLIVYIWYPTDTYLLKMSRVDIRFAGPTRNSRSQDLGIAVVARGWARGSLPLIGFLRRQLFLNDGLALDDVAEDSQNWLRHPASIGLDRLFVP